MLLIPGKFAFSQESALELPEVGRYVRGRRDGRLLRLSRLCLHPERLPRIVDDELHANGCDLAHLERELHRLGHQVFAGYQNAGLPALWPEEDAHSRLAVIGFAAAAPLWQLALQQLAELDASFIALRTDDFVAWDVAVSAPIARWSAGGRGAPKAPSLRELVRDAIAAHRVALLAQLTLAPSLSARDELLTLWSGAVASSSCGVERRSGAKNPAGSSAVAHATTALLTLRDAISTRRRELRELGAAVDEATRGLGEETSMVAVALTIAARMLIARGVVGGVADWLADLSPVPAETSSLARIRLEATRVLKIGEGMERWFATSLAAIDALIGMEI